MITFDCDIYQGITLHNQDFPSNPALFEIEIDALLKLAQSTHKRIIWVTLCHEQAELIAVLTRKNFVFHSCMEKSITLILRVKEAVYVPFSPTHTIGLGGVVLTTNANSVTQVLVIKEHLGDVFKLPGGHMELDETIEIGAIRETYEETGIQTQFKSIVAVASKYPYQLGKSNIFLACSLTPLNYDIHIQDTDEIEIAMWMDLETFFSHREVAPFAQELVSSTLKQDGLTRNELILSNQVEGKRELFTF